MADEEKKPELETTAEAKPEITDSDTKESQEDDAAAAKKKKKSKKRTVARGRAYIKATYNNTIVTFTDQHGNTLVSSSAGRCGFKGPKKSTPYAAGIIVKDASERVKDYGLRTVDVYVRGIGSGRDGAIRALNAQGFSMQSIKDITPIPHNGCRQRKLRRV
ncbi:MAG: 30S ribosomal protein S11 [Candidatus Kerfeldbacteria bacterium]